MAPPRQRFYGKEICKVFDCDTKFDLLEICQSTRITDLLTRPYLPFSPNQQPHPHYLYPKENAHRIEARKIPTSQPPPSTLFFRWCNVIRVNWWSPKLYRHGHFQTGYVIDPQQFLIFSLLFHFVAFVSFSPDAVGQVPGNRARHSIFYCWYLQWWHRATDIHNPRRRHRRLHVYGTQWWGTCLPYSKCYNSGRRYYHGKKNQCDDELLKLWIFFLFIVWFSFPKNKKYNKYSICIIFCYVSSTFLPIQIY